MQKSIKKENFKHQLALEEFIRNHNGVEDLLTPVELEEYQKLEYPDNVHILHDALKLRIEKDPEYELWVPSIYVTWKICKAGEQQFFINQYQFVSSKGRIINLRGHKGKHTGHNSNGYRHVNLKLERVNRPYVDTSMHRLVASVFIPIPQHLKDIPYSKLEVNHIFGIKTNNNFQDLEWCTRKENVVHSYDTNLKSQLRGLANPLSKPLIGTCVLKGHEGKEILLVGKKAIRAMGFHQGKISACAKKGKGVSYGCTWRYATNDDIINHNNAKYDLDFINALKR